MSATESGSHNLDPRRKRARFRAWHRGTREMDLILGPFADKALATMTDVDLAEFEQLLEVSDTDLLKWFTGADKAPSERDTELFRSIAVFQGSVHN